MRPSVGAPTRGGIRAAITIPIRPLAARPSVTILCIRCRSGVRAADTPRRVWHRRSRSRPVLRTSYDGAAATFRPGPGHLPTVPCQGVTVRGMRAGSSPTEVAPAIGLVARVIPQSAPGIAREARPRSTIRIACGGAGHGSIVGGSPAASWRCTRSLAPRPRDTRRSPRQRAVAIVATALRPRRTPPVALPRALLPVPRPDTIAPIPRSTRAALPARGGPAPARWMTRRRSARRMVGTATTPGGGHGRWPGLRISRRARPRRRGSARARRPLPGGRPRPEEVARVARRPLPVPLREPGGDQLGHRSEE